MSKAMLFSYCVLHIITKTEIETITEFKPTKTSHVPLFALHFSRSLKNTIIIVIIPKVRLSSDYQVNDMYGARRAHGP